MVNSRMCGRRGILDRECFQWMKKIRDYKYHRRNKCSQASIICDGRKSSILEALVKNIVMSTLEGDDVMKTGLREKQRNVRHQYQIQSSKMKVWGSCATHWSLSGICCFSFQLPENTFLSLGPLSLPNYRCIGSLTIWPRFSSKIEFLVLHTITSYKMHKSSCQKPPKGWIIL